MRERDREALRHVRRRQVQDGTLILTDLQLIWRHDGPGRGFELPLESIDVVGRHQGLEEPGAFVVGISVDGEFESLLFLPGTPKRPASVARAEQLARDIRRSRNRRLAVLRELEDQPAG